MTEEEEPIENNCKIIKLLPLPTIKENRKIETKKPKKIRAIIEPLVLQDTDYQPEIQWKLLCGENSIEQQKTNEYESVTKWKIIKQHISNKIQGYKSQDQKNTIYMESEFVTMKFVLELLRSSEMRCYYCKEWVQLLYRHVREPRQWTLERIDNDIGHNCGNVVIACLSCNLRRRCMYHERFLFTKQLNIKKIEDMESI